MTKLQRDARAGWHAARRQPRSPMQLSTTVIGTPLPELTPCKCCGTSVCSKVSRGWAVAEPGITFDGDYKPRGYDSAAWWKVDNVTIGGVIAPPEAERCQCGCWEQKRPAHEPVQAEPQHDVRSFKRAIGRKVEGD